MFCESDSIQSSVRVCEQKNRNSAPPGLDSPLDWPYWIGISVRIHEYPWSIDFHGHPWISMDCNKSFTGICFCPVRLCLPHGHAMACTCLALAQPQFHKMLNRLRNQISKKNKKKDLQILPCVMKKMKNILERSSTLRVSRAEIWLTVYRSIYIIRMQRGIAW